MMSSSERRELLKQTFKTSCSLMLQSKELPYNPYPTLVRDLRQVQSELEFSHIDISEKKSYFNQQVQTLGDTGICMTNTEPALYGTRNVLNNINVASLVDVYQLAGLIRPPEDYIQSDEDSYEFDCAISITGSNLFDSVLYDKTSHVTDIRLHYIAYLDKDTRESLFSFMAENLVLHLEYIASMRQQLFLGVTIETNDAEPVFWSAARIEDNSDRFMAAVKKSISTRGRIYTEMVLVTNKGVEYRARLLYCLTEVEEERDRRGDIITKVCRDYTLLPLQSLYDGVFVTQTDIETYAGAYLSSLIETDDEPVKIRRVNQSLITQAVYDSWTDSLSGLDLHLDLDRILHPLLLCALNGVGLKSQRTDDILTEMCKLMKTKGGQLLLLRQDRKHLKNLLQDLGTSTDKIMVKLVNKCVNRCNKSHTLYLRENPQNEEMGVTHLVENQLGKLTEAFSLKDINKMIDILHAIDGLLIPAELTSLIGTLKQVTTLRKLLRSVQKIEPTEVSVPELVSGEMQISYVAGDSCSNRDKVRVSTVSLIGMSSEKQAHAFIAYCMDNHLYDIWHQITSEDTETDNPLHAAMQRFWQAGYQMEMNQKSTTDLHTQITKGIAYSKVAVDPDLFIYRAGSENIYGLRTALTNLHLPNIIEISTLARKLQQKSMVVDEVQIETCITISELASQYGNVLVYMDMLDLNEYWFIKSDSDRVQNSLRIFSEAILSHLKQCKDEGSRIILYKLNVGEEEWIGDSINTETERIKSALVKSMSTQQHISMTYYMEYQWRYLRVKKVLLPATVDVNKKQVFRFHPSSDMNVYTDLYTDRDAMRLFMSIHLIEHNNADPYTESCMTRVIRIVEGKAKEAYGRRDYFRAMKALLIKCYLTQGSTSSVLVESYKYFHSLAAEIRLVLHISKSLMEIFKLVMSTPDDGHAVNLNMLSRQFTHNQRLLLSVSDDNMVSFTMTPPSFNRHIRVKLRSMLDISVAEPRLLINEQSVRTMSEIIHTLQTFYTEYSKRAFSALCEKSQVSIESL